MQTITESIDAPVPVAFANHEWSSYLFRSFYYGTPMSSDAFTDGTVTFEPLDANSSKVTIKMGYEQQAGGESEAEAHLRLATSLQGYRSFVTDRCEKTHCLNAA